MTENKYTRSGMVWTGITAVLIAAVAIIFFRWPSGKANGGKAEQVTVGIMPGPGALIYIAQDRSFFTENGLKVSIVDHKSGVETTDALLKKEVDFSLSAEFPVICKVFEKREVSVIAVVSRFTSAYLLGLRASGIRNILDLKGKKIGVPMNTNGGFYLARFLELHGLSMKDISVIDIPAAKAPEAVAAGGIDAVVTWERFAEQIREISRDKVVAWPVQSNQPGYGIITCRNDWIEGNGEIVHRFLKSLVKAENYLIHNPKEAKDIVQKSAGIDDRFIKELWSEYRFSLSLEQSLIAAMEGEARWMIDSNLTGEKTTPDFLDYIHENALKKIKPEVVNIIR